MTAELNNSDFLPSAGKLWILTLSANPRRKHPYRPRTPDEIVTNQDSRCSPTPPKLLRTNPRKVRESFNSPPGAIIPQIQIWLSIRWLLLAWRSLLWNKVWVDYMGQTHSHVYQDPGCPTRTLCCSLDHCHFVCQWFQCCSWLMYISDWRDARHSPVSFSKSLKYLGYIPEGGLINHNLGIVQISVSMATLSPWAMNLQRCIELHGSQHLKATKHTS